MTKSIFSFLFVMLLWLRIALWLALLTHDGAVAFLLAGAFALAIFLALCELVERRSRSYRAKTALLRRLREVRR